MHACVCVPRCLSNFVILIFYSYTFLMYSISSEKKTLPSNNILKEDRVKHSSEIGRKNRKKEKERKENEKDCRQKKKEKKKKQRHKFLNYSNFLCKHTFNSALLSDLFGHCRQMIIYENSLFLKSK